MQKVNHHAAEAVTSTIPQKSGGASGIPECMPPIRRRTFKVIIDCDPGIDDALALMLAAASPELEILGITIVSGNVPARMGAGNARKVLKQLNRLDIPIYIGEEKPLKVKYVDASRYPWPGRAGRKVFCLKCREISTKNTRWNFWRRLLEKEKLSIIALGPMTNLARLFQKRPDLIGRVERLVSMGGSFKSHGNCSPGGRV